MKKTYITPDMRSIELEKDILLTESMPVETSNPVDASESLSRDAAEPSSSSLWDQEW